ncbi:AEC family transporter [Acinetobacter rathckeae]|uniref:permease n=1 Tax=Acinetobacter rathckeae TaxID=2605272 RepID=UPI0018A317D8|nr:permease [Acinetobacter rathckeae]MBF7696404.1 permease [Acinetobacter rathckeae]
MPIILPILSFIFGWFISSYGFLNVLRPLLSKLLARCFIPFVIVYNMLFYQAGSMFLMLFSVLSSVVVYAVCSMVFKDRLVALCASYNNIGWLGFPLALLIFGQSVSAAMIALYVGSSIFGNVWAIPAVSKAKPKWQEVIKKVLQAPPMIALSVAVILRLFAVQNILHEQWWLLDLYAFAKFAMVFAGMAVLGMWLSQTKVSMNDLKYSCRMMWVKLAIGAVLCTALYFMTSNRFVHEHIALLYFLFCLPPAANIVALETHYSGTGKSAQYIAAGTIVSVCTIALFALLYF